jgi:S1-C subfamily serine protease
MSLAPEQPDTGAALDAYSRVVTAVAGEVTPHVAALQVSDAYGRAGAGSAVVFTGDGLLLTNAHVVGGTRSGKAVFSDGSESDVDVVGADPLSDLAVVRARTTTPPPAELGTPRRCGLASSSWPWATRSGWPGRSRPGW